MKKVDLTNQVFERLLVKSYAGSRRGCSFWNCVCRCGKEKIVASAELRRGNVRSCGCLHENSGSSPIHGDCRNSSRTSEYCIWGSMRQRCSNPKAKGYKNYGGRNIKVCQRWLMYDNFLTDMGRRPSKNHSLDRVDVNGDYEPENCRWATREQQAANKRNKRIEQFTTQELLTELKRRNDGKIP